MLDAAIVGLGRWGKNFVESVQYKSERVRFVRGVDKAPEKVREFAERHDLPLCSELSEVLADPAIKAVVIVTPHSLHRPMVEAAAAAGKHVFCEKPLALNILDARAMIEACRRAGVVLGVGHNRRLWPSMQALKRVVRSGALGEILHIEGHFSNEHSNNTAGTWRDSPTESPGGGMTGAGLHILDAFLDLIGPVRRVRGQLVVKKPPPVPRDVAAVLFEFANGVSGMMATVRASPFYGAFTSLATRDRRSHWTSTSSRCTRAMPDPSGARSSRSMRSRRNWKCSPAQSRTACRFPSRPRRCSPPSARSKPW